MEPVLLYPIKYQLAGYGQVTAMDMMDHLFKYHRAIENIDLEENTAKMMVPYNPEQPLVQLIDKLGKGLEFAHSGGQTNTEMMMVYKRITLLAQNAILNEDIKECRGQPGNLNIWAEFKVFFHHVYQKKRRAVTTVEK